MSRTPRIGVPTVARRARRTGPYQAIVKPVIDRAAGIVFAVLAAPLVLILVVVARLTFGKAIVREPRIGRGGKEFRLFRICTTHADGRDLRGRGHKLAQFIRQWSLDELPQLWNIVLGQMSLVGPRPLHPDAAAQLQSWQRRRHDVKPGLTGLWQVGARGDGRRLLDNVHYDIQYIDQVSFLTDLRILFLSPGMWALRREQHETHRRSGSGSHRRIDHLRLITTDLLLWPLASTAALYTWYEFSLAPIDWTPLIGLWLAAAAAQLVWGWAAGLYRGRWQLGSGDEAAWVAAGTAGITALLLGISSFGTELAPPGAIIAAGTFHLIGAFASRYLARISYARQRRATHQRGHRLIVFGAGRAGIDAAQALLEDPHSDQEPVVFLDDDRAKRGSQHHDLPVVGNRRAIAATAQRYGADRMLVAMPSTAAETIEEIVGLGIDAGLQVEVLPALTQTLASLLVEHAQAVEAKKSQRQDWEEPLVPALAPTGRSFDLAVIGLGYVGLPVVIEAGKAGLKVAGLDINADLVAALAAGRSHVADVTDQELAEALAAGFTPTNDASVLASADVITISVPTPLRDELPDLNAVISASESVGKHLGPGQTVVLESTTYPGTTEEIVRPVLEELSGLRAGVDFHLAYSPERIDPGNEEWGAHNTPKIVGGIDEESAERAAQLYRKFAPVVMVKGTQEAEMAKLLENTYRHVNIALINEMAVFCDLLGIDIWEVIRGAATKPFGFQAFYPGPGVGGHCIPIDPNYLSYRVRQLGSQFRMIELAQEINDFMPGYVARRALDLLRGNGLDPADCTVLVLGVAYKPGIADTRETTAEPLIRSLRAAGARVKYSDPFVTDFAVDGIRVEREVSPAAGHGDLAIIHTPHQHFDFDAICDAFPSVLDTRGVTSSGQAHQL